MENAAAKELMGKQTEVKASAGQWHDIVEFASEDYYCSEEEGRVELQVLRLGDAKGNVKVRWYTEDGSAKADMKYISGGGTLEFAEGERDKKIVIELLGDESFDAVLEFNVVLAEPEGAKLGMYLYKTEVSIADDDTFPTNLYSDKLTSKQAHTIPPVRLFLEYVRMHLKDRSFKRSFYVCMFLDQFTNVQAVWLVFLTQHLIDNVLKRSDGTVPPDVVLQVILIVVCSLVPHLLILWLNHWKASKGLAGTATIRLQENLMRKFLNYNEASRSAVSTSDLTMAITRDVPELVQKGLLTMLPLVQKIGLLFAFGTLAVMSSPYPGIMVFNVLIFPLVLVCFLKIRQPGSDRRHRQLFSTQTSIVSTVQLITDYYRLIEDYFQKQEMVVVFSEKVQACNEAWTQSHIWRLANEHFAPFLTDAFCGMFVFLSFQSVIDGQLGIGEFVTGMGIWRGIGRCYQEIYEDILTMEHAIAPLHNVVHYMNLPTDTTDRLVLGRTLLQNLDGARQASEALIAGKDSHVKSRLVQESPMIQSGDIVERAVYAQDLIQICCENLTFAYPDCPAVLQEAYFDIPQGKLVAIIGPRGGGKATLLKMLSGVLVPTADSGLLFLPPHLRVLHVCHDPQIVHDLGLMANLCFGPSDGPDEEPRRVQAICERLGMSEEAMAGIKKITAGLSESEGQNRCSASNAALGASLGGEESKVQSQIDNIEACGTPDSIGSRVNTELRSLDSTLLSHTDRCLIHIARAFVMNPEVLVIHKPMTHFDDLQAGRVLELLREFVNKRGVEKSPEEQRLSRPHTCIFSASALEGIDKADLVLQVGNGKVQEVDTESLRDLLAKAKSMFKDLDANGDGNVNRNEFIEKMIDMPEALELFGLHSTQIEKDAPFFLGKAFDQVDHGRNGEINIEELVHYMRAELHSHVPTKDKNKAQKVEADDLRLLSVPPPPVVVAVVEDRTSWLQGAHNTFSNPEPTTSIPEAVTLPWESAPIPAEELHPRARNSAEACTPAAFEYCAVVDNSTAILPQQWCQVSYRRQDVEKHSPHSR